LYKLSLPQRIFRVVPGDTEIQDYPFADLEERKDWDHGEDVETACEEGIYEPASVEESMHVATAEELDAAYQRGLTEGRELGYKEAKEQLAEEFAVAADLVRQWRQKVDEALQQAEIPVVRLAFEIAKKVIHSEIRQNPDMIHYVVREAVRRISHASHAEISLHPADLERLEADPELLRELRERVDQLTFRADEAIRRGGCVVETNVGLVDATLESQLNEIEKSLFGDLADAA
jgi:flagellar assembly protein FliH